MALSLTETEISACPIWEAQKAHSQSFLAAKHADLELQGTLLNLRTKIFQLYYRDTRGPIIAHSGDENIPVLRLWPRDPKLAQPSSKADLKLLTDLLKESGDLVKRLESNGYPYITISYSDPLNPTEKRGLYELGGPSSVVCVKPFPKKGFIGIRRMDIDHKVVFTAFIYPIGQQPMISQENNKVSFSTHHLNFFSKLLDQAI